MWKQLATAVVFGLGIATVLTLIVTPSFLALRVWVSTYASWIMRLLARLTSGRSSRVAQDMRLKKAMRKLPTTEILWDAGTGDTPAPKPTKAANPNAPTPLKAAE